MPAPHSRDVGAAPLQLFEQRHANPLRLCDPTWPECNTQDKNGTDHINPRTLGLTYGTLKG